MPVSDSDEARELLADVRRWEQQREDEEADREALEDEPWFRQLERDGMIPRMDW